MAFITTTSGLQLEDTVVGTGAEAAPGRNVTVQYNGWLYQNGEQGANFESSNDCDEPFIFPFRGGMVIKGWDEGVQDMKEGGQHTPSIPANLAYGARDAGGVIPLNATLKFDVELLALENWRSRRRPTRARSVSAVLKTLHLRNCQKVSREPLHRN